jgi:hypothetical protein
MLNPMLAAKAIGIYGRPSGTFSFEKYYRQGKCNLSRRDILEALQTDGTYRLERVGGRKNLLVGPPGDSVPNRWRYRLNDQTYIEIRQEIMDALRPELWEGNNEWLMNHFDVFYDQREILQKVSRWISHGIIHPQTKRERSLAVFGDDKTLESPYTRRILHNVGCLTLVENELHPISMTFETTIAREPWVSCQDSPVVLISENLEPWHHLSVIASEGKSAFGLSSSAVVFGNGNRITTNKGSDFAEWLEVNHIPHEARLLYWGDVDKMGFAMPEKAQAGLIEHGFQKLEPLIPAYELMGVWAARHEGTELMPESIDLRPNSSGSMFLESILTSSHLSEDARQAITRVMDTNGRVPQECLGIWEITEGQVEGI